MVVDSLLQKLNATGCRAQAYAHELVIMVLGNHFNKVTDLMQISLRVMDSWYKTKGLSVNPEKTEVVPFIRKRKTD